MERIHESNQRRFRLTLGGLVIGITWFFIVFGEKISNWIRSMTTGLALETLEDKSIKIQTQELAMAVVQTVLNDKQVTAQAATFLREAAQTPETQEALLKLTLHVLQHPDSVEQLTLLSKQVISELSKDKVPNCTQLLGPHPS
jgi:Flp pilus assembly protein TadD